jgi:hypothetical protein
MKNSTSVLYCGQNCVMRGVLSSMNCSYFAHAPYHDARQTGPGKIACGLVARRQSL